MPMYDYRCNACQREFEIQQRMTDDDLVKCEACGEDKLEKLISWAAFGSGGAGGLYSSSPKDSIKVDRGKPPKKEVKAEPAPAAPTADTLDEDDDEPAA
jgi:putative FmdB family regulatory protein